jgi:hypothetical protein
MVGHLQILLEGATKDPEWKIAELPMLTAGERQMLLAQLNPAVQIYDS